MFIDRFGKDWKDADQYAKDNRRSHTACSKEESARLARELELERKVKMYRNIDRYIFSHRYDPHRYFAGSVFDFIRFSRTKSECFWCHNLYTPTTTAAEIYENISKKTKQ